MSCWRKKWPTHAYRYQMGGTVCDYVLKRVHISMIAVCDATVIVKYDRRRIGLSNALPNIE